jgi:hypothetical protein
MHQPLRVQRDLNGVRSSVCAPFERIRYEDVEECGVDDPGGHGDGVPSDVQGAKNCPLSPAWGSHYPTAGRVCDSFGTAYDRA